jgi:hypothetical protein
MVRGNYEILPFTFSSCKDLSDKKIFNSEIKNGDAIIIARNMPVN